jgi:putative FmdB family regulatory protein
MPYYEFQCPKCHERVTVFRKIADSSLPQFCQHVGPDSSTQLVKMERRVSRFLFTANRAVDMPENQEARLVTRSGSRSDWLEYERNQEKQWERKVADMQAEEKAVLGSAKEDGFGDCDIQGCWMAANAGPEQLKRWRKDNIPADDFEVAASG